MTKICSKCGEEKPLSDFYENKRLKDGHEGRCKQCVKSYSKEYAKKHRAQRNAYNKRYYERNPEKLKAKKEKSNQRKRELYKETGYVYNPLKRQYYSKEKYLKRYHQKKERDLVREKLRNAVKSGRIKKPLLCEKCGASGILHGHHEDYSKPLEVQWLCYVCHDIIHGRIKHLIHFGLLVAQ